MSLSSSISGGGGGAAGAGTGDVVGPASATDNAVARFNGAGGKTLQDSLLVVGDTGIVTGATRLTVDSLILDGNSIQSSDDDDLVLNPGGLGNVTVASGDLLLANPLAVAEGGTGAATLTDGGVLLGSGTGAITATALGTAGQVLTSNGAGADPTFQDATGGGVTDHGALTGLADDDHTQYLLVDGTRATTGNLTIGAGLELRLPLENVAATPTLNFGDGDTGFYEEADDNLQVSIAGVKGFHFHLNGASRAFASANASGGTIYDIVTSATAPTFTPNYSDFDTGIGSAGADQLSLIAGAVEIARLSEGVAGVSNGMATFRRVEANTAGVGAPNALAAIESRSVLTNEGATAMNHHTLPTAAAGLEFMFYVQDADGITITAATGDTIRVAGGVSSAGGTAANSTIGGFIQLIAINATEWVAGATQGTWVLA